MLLHTHTRSRPWLFASLLGLGLCSTQAATGLATIDSTSGAASVTIFYPSSSTAQTVNRGPFILQLAPNGTPMQGNQRLIVISHGSGGAQWTFVDLAHSLVNAGFIVAMPEHEGDNYRDHKWVGIETWKRRPAEVSAAIDVMRADTRFGGMFDSNRVGVYGMSAGGLTALTVAGAQWSPANFQKHCIAHVQDDFSTCVGLTTRLRGDALDGIKIALARAAHRAKTSDETLYQHHDPRIRAAVATVPMAAPIQMDSLAKPTAAIGLVTAGLDTWLVPRFHSDEVRKACSLCEMVADMPSAGHGSTLSPWPQDLAASIAPMLVDPPGFNRQALPGVYAKIVAFFNRHLLSAIASAP